MIDWYINDIDWDGRGGCGVIFMGKGMQRGMQG